MEKFYSGLQDPENFDPHAFIAGEHASQELCDFMLSATLFFNDLKDVILVHGLLREKSPKEKSGRTKEWGAFCGMEIHAIRQTMSLVHEFLEVIKANERIFKTEFYKKIYMQMTRKSRECWDAVLEVALKGKETTGPLVKLLHRVRNHASFHFEPRALGRGYKEMFFSGGRVKQKAVISRGNTMGSSRFYFADAAAQQCVVREQKQDPTDMINEFSQFLENINQSVFELVDKFILRRNFQYLKGAE
ncbi:MAG TPA: hypothetical protein PKI45_06010 [Candidatus Omnitrophota bacterium]|nr:hypothetical protein [Candidatus Omnitrophota bacterium]